MKDEEFVFYKDIQEKKATARAARYKNRKGHGMVKLPSDYKTKKELQQMSSEVKTYKLSAPMTFSEFSAMPIDIQQAYINNLLVKFPRLNQTQFSEMLNILPQNWYRYKIKKGLVFQGLPGIKHRDDKFEEWIKRDFAEAEDMEVTEETGDIMTEEITESCEPFELKDIQAETAESDDFEDILKSCSVVIYGTSEDVYRLVKSLCANKKKRWRIVMTDE